MYLSSHLGQNYTYTQQMHNNTWDHNTSRWKREREREKNWFGDYLSSGGWGEGGFCHHLVIASNQWPTWTEFMSAKTKKPPTHSPGTRAHNSFFFLLPRPSDTVGSTKLDRSTKKKNTPLRHPKLAIVLSYSSRRL